jgi:hypothetical protein
MNQQFDPLENKHFSIPIEEVCRQAPPTRPKYPMYMATDELGLHTAVIISTVTRDGRISGFAYPLRPDAVKAIGGVGKVEYKMPGAVDKTFRIGSICREHVPPLRLAGKMPNQLMGEFESAVFFGVRDFIRQKRKTPSYTGKEEPSDKEKRNIAVAGRVSSQLANKVVSCFLYDMKSAMDLRLVAIANKFPFRCGGMEFASDKVYNLHLFNRYNMYVALCLHGERLEQMCEVFPYLVRVAICNRQVMDMIIEGRRIGDIVDSLDIQRKPFMRTKHIRPQLTCMPVNLHYNHVPDDMFPKRSDSPMAQKLKISMASMVVDRGLHKGNMPKVLANVIDKYVGRRRVPPVIQEGLAEFITHAADWAMMTGVHINRHMSPERLIERVDEWDAQRLAALPEMDSDCEFPEAWLSRAEFNIGKISYVMSYIPTSVKLQEEGRAMRHCVGGYADSVLNGKCQIYSVRTTEGGRVATVEIKNSFDDLAPAIPRYRVDQIRGKANKKVDDKIVRKINQIVRKRERISHVDERLRISSMEQVAAEA